MGDGGDPPNGPDPHLGAPNLWHGKKLEDNNYTAVSVAPDTFSKQHDPTATSGQSK